MTRAHNMLLLSSPIVAGYHMYEHAAEPIAQMFGDLEVVFVPYALSDWGAYTAKVREALEPYGVSIVGIHEYDDPSVGLEDAQAVYVGGGNTFRLLEALRRQGLLNKLRSRVDDGISYLGASAGTLITSPSISTTNDMPIVDPHGFDALGLLPFQFNCHYRDTVDSGFMAETRDLRLRQYLEENNVPVLALCEGAWLTINTGRATMGGLQGGKFFRDSDSPVTIVPSGSDVSWLLGL